MTEQPVVEVIGGSAIGAGRLEFPVAGTYLEGFQPFNNLTVKLIWSAPC
ncbi:MAG: hypothetical protein RLZZ165_1092 [Bacteroidota bacterium]